MAWPGNFGGYNAFWEAMAAGPGGPHGGPRGAGVDRAAPDMFTYPDSWNRWAQPGEWGEDFGPRGYGRRGGHFRGRGGGGRHGHRHHGGPDAAGPSDDNNDDAPPYYSDEDGVAAESSGKEKEKEKENSSDTMMREDIADRPEDIPDEDDSFRRRHRGCHGQRHGSCGGRGGRGGFGARGGPGHHGPGQRGPHHGPGPHGRDFHHHGPPPPFPFGHFGGMGGPHGHHSPHGHGHPRGPPPPPPPPMGGFPFEAILNGLASHPYAQQLREYLERAQTNTHGKRNVNNDDDNNERSSDEEGMEVFFQPPADVFDQLTQWVIHFAVPGAKKEDVSVNWDADRSVLSISGVIYRPGDEKFLESIVTSERVVGHFGRDIRLPLAEGQGHESGKDEVDADGIAAKMEDGVLIVTVPKVEKGWTEVRKVGIE